LKKPDNAQHEQSGLEILPSLNILDGSSEERFDRLTRMAKRLLAVPIALVGLLDENRRCFESCMGPSAGETPREGSFCRHALLGNEIFVVSNAVEDQRFADHPAVAHEPRIRFYGGCPLRGLNGQKLGTLCIMDQKPRTLGKEDLEALRDLASMAERDLAAVQLATLDELTSISNRRGFMMLAQYSLHLCARQKIPASLVFLDLDKFKPINDTFGHAEGDHALAVFADHMKRTYRDSDLFARLGGDEFAILLTNTSKKLAEEVVVRFTQSIARHNQQAHRGYDILFSYGIVEFDAQKHHTIEELLAEGDSLMYEIKNTRRDDLILRTTLA
jgi:diguanylate cyclase (GGDEF)-like protein